MSIPPLWARWTSFAPSLTSEPKITAIGMIAITMQTTTLSAAARLLPLPKRRSNRRWSGWKMMARITAQNTALKKGRRSQKNASVIAARSRKKALCCTELSRPDTPRSLGVAPWQARVEGAPVQGAGAAGLPPPSRSARVVPAAEIPYLLGAHSRGRHGPHPDHLRAPVHQRGQAPRQPRRQPASGRRLCPLHARPRPRGAVHLRHRRARHPGRARRRQDRRDRSPTIARGCGRCRRRSPTASGCPSTTYGRSSSPQNHRLTQHFAGRLADAGLISEVTEKQIYSLADGRFLPDRYIEGTCPNCGYPRARGDQCENCTKQLDPTDLIEPRSAISGSTDLEVRETKHLYLRQSLMRDRLRGVDRHQDRLAGAVDLDRPQVARRRRGPAGPLDHPRPRLGHPGPARRRALAGDGGQGLLRLVRRADRVHRRDRRVGGRERPRRGGVAALVARGRGRGGRHLRRVHGQGQRALPHAVASRRRSSGRGSRGSSSTTSRASTISITRAGNSRPPRAAASSWTRPSRCCRPTIGAGG